MTQIPIQPDDEVLAWLRGKTAADLKAIEAHEVCSACLGAKRAKEGACGECEGTGKALAPRNFFPESLRYRGPTGDVIEEPVLFVVPREDDLEEATREAVKHVAQKHPDMKVKTPAQATELIGELRFALLETRATVSLCTRVVQPPHIRAYRLHVLIQRFDPSTLDDAYTRIDMIRRAWDVRVRHLTEDQFWGVASEVARVKNTSPLVVLDPVLHEPFVTRLAAEAMRSRTGSSSTG